ncbi:MAG: hypothetical protein BGO23_00390 [Solirubrobacterales bacterium 67-14]|nr:MAG: hypothetical protein BGO23_00390 [Solirubrobacterales bacterium 67-14]
MGVLVFRISQVENLRTVSVSRKKFLDHSLLEFVMCAGSKLKVDSWGKRYWYSLHLPIGTQLLPKCLVVVQNVCE